MVSTKGLYLKISTYMISLIDFDAIIMYIVSNVSSTL